MHCSWCQRAISRFLQAAAAHGCAGCTGPFCAGFFHWDGDVGAWHDENFVSAAFCVRANQVDTAAANPAASRSRWPRHRPLVRATRVSSLRRKPTPPAPGRQKWGPLESPDGGRASIIGARDGCLQMGTCKPMRSWLPKTWKPSSCKSPNSVPEVLCAGCCNLHTEQRPEVPDRSRFLEMGYTSSQVG